MAILDLLYELAPWELINTFFIPFVVIFVMLWGILTAMGIFKNRKINIVISLGMVLFLASTDIFPMVSQWMIQLGSLTAVAAFLLLFVGGVIIWGIGRGQSIYHGSNPYRALKKIDNEIAKLNRKIGSEGNPQKQARMVKRMRELEDERVIVKAEMRG